MLMPARPTASNALASVPGRSSRTIVRSVAMAVLLLALGSAPSSPRRQARRARCASTSAAQQALRGGLPPGALEQLGEHRLVNSGEPHVHPAEAPRVGGLRERLRIQRE